MKKHKYVALTSVLAILTAAFALFGLMLFTAAFLYRWSKLATVDGARYDLINVEDNMINVITIITIFLMMFFLLIMVLRQVEKMRHPDTIMVTLEYVDENGNRIRRLQEIQVPKIEKTEEKAAKKKDSGDRFQKLILLDKQYPKKEYVTSTEDLTLEYLCRRFRSFASRIAGNPLYYSIDDIRRFVSALGVTKIMILQYKSFHNGSPCIYYTPKL